VRQRAGRVPEVMRGLREEPIHHATEEEEMTSLARPLVIVQQ
jgi:hypothetical protein